MSLATLVLSQPRTIAPQSAVSVLAPSAAKARATLTGMRTATAAKAEQPPPVEDQARKQRLARKDQAKQEVLALVERICTLKQFASDNPEVMAKQLAQIVKALKSALKAYAAAGGTPPPGASAGVPAATVPAAKTDAAADPAEPETADAGPSDGPGPVATETPDIAAVQTGMTQDTGASPRSEVRGSDLYSAMKDRLSGSEAVSDMTFVKDVKDLGKAIRVLLEKARVQMAFKPMDDETKQAFEDADEGLKEIDEALDKMDRDIRASSPEAGLFIGLYA